MTKRESKVMRNFQFKLVTQIERGEFEAVTLKNKFFVKWLVGYMAEQGHPFQVVRLGPGVVRVIRGGLRCPHCQGKGFIADKAPATMATAPATAEKADYGCATVGCGGNCGGCRAKAA